MGKTTMITIIMMKKSSKQKKWSKCQLTENSTENHFSETSKKKSFRSTENTIHLTKMLLPNQQLLLKKSKKFKPDLFTTIFKDRFKTTFNDRFSTFSNKLLDQFNTLETIMI